MKITKKGIPLRRCPRCNELRYCTFIGRTKDSSEIWRCGTCKKKFYIP